MNEDNIQHLLIKKKILLEYYFLVLNSEINLRKYRIFYNKHARRLFTLLYVRCLLEGSTYFKVRGIHYFNVNSNKIIERENIKVSTIISLFKFLYNHTI